MKFNKSDEELEYEFNKDIERLKNQPSFITYFDKFLEKPTGMGAKYLWLEYTKAELEVPDEVTKVMISTMETEIKHYLKGGERERSFSGGISLFEEQIPIYGLLHCAKNEPDRFWQIVHPSDEDKEPIHLHPEWLIENIRVEYPERTNVNFTEWCEFFGRQLGMENGDNDYDIGVRMRDRYRNTYEKKLEKMEELFK